LRQHPLGPSQCFVLIRQSDSPSPCQFWVDRWVRRELAWPLAAWKICGRPRHGTKLGATSNLRPEVHPAAALDRGRPGASGSNRLTRTGLNLPLLSSGSLPFTPERFHLILNSAEFFSTFLHGTCSLSVSWSYLALDAVCHHLSAPQSRNTILWSRQYLRY